MAMKNTETHFYGKQEDEKILYVVRPHPLAFLFKAVRVYGFAIIVFFAFFLIGQQITSLVSVFTFLGATLGIIIVIGGTKVLGDYQKRNMSYITDRRVAHFEPTTLFATNSRTLSWDEVVKVKTYPSNMFWKQLAIGNVVLHARTPARLSENEGAYETASVDDIELKDVYYYRDLGNYIDKILFTYKKRPKEVDLIKPFVPKPAGQRY